ncbi:MAG TPA: glutamyl-tRNA reductase [Gemmatimonadales bacterium]|jgi:glutamyl-tRNA reductase|nr:glutamyl-tRNA reductase [Gemmatimonadales bacterium]
MPEESPSPARPERLRALSIHHPSASLEELERVTLSPAAAHQLCRRLLESGVSAVVLSTCHRAELYWESRDPIHDQLAESALRASAPGGWSGLEGKVCRLRGEVAAYHLLRVAAGLESVLVGEAEVVGQIRSAVEIADRAGMRARILVELFRDALRFGRLARARTRIGEGALSVASAAVQLLHCTHRDLGECTVLVVGAGTVGLRVVRHLLAERVGRCVLLNRTLARAEAAAEESGVTAAPLDELPEWLAQASAVVVAAQADAPLLTAETVRAARAGAAPPPRPLVIMDASMPRAVDPAVAGIADVLLRDLSGLEALVESNRARREAEIPVVEALLEDTLAARRRREQRHHAWLLGAAMGQPAR